MSVPGYRKSAASVAREACQSYRYSYNPTFCVCGTPDANRTDQQADCRNKLQLSQPKLYPSHPFDPSFRSRVHRFSFRVVRWEHEVAIGVPVEID